MTLLNECFLEYNSSKEIGKRDQREQKSCKTHLNRSQTLYLSCETLSCKIRETSKHEAPVSFIDYKGTADWLLAIF